MLDDSIVGRPKKKHKTINPVRQVGRWGKKDWDKVKRAAHSLDKSVPEALRPVIMRWAERILNDG